MEWIQPEGFNPEDEEPQTWQKMTSNLWNHVARNVESVPTDRIFFFGGQTSPREFTNNIAIMDAGTMEWSPFTMQGAPPPSREDCGIGYNGAACDLIFFGGWKQKWLDDLWVLNVAGVVGPPYAVMQVEPNTGPLTGGTPVILQGLRFIESPMINVRFTDGKRDANCNGQFISDTQIKCTSPDFSKFGAADVVVRLSISGDPFTVNEAKFIYYANTSAKKSMAFGPGLLQSNFAGQVCSFIVQAKDLHGKIRTTGLDPLQVVIKGPAKNVQEAFVTDMKNGTYEVQYFVPSPGEYTIEVSIDENPYDGNLSYNPVRGFPVALNFVENWNEVKVAGTWPKLKGWMRAWAADSDKVVVVVKEEEDKGIPDLASEMEVVFYIEPPKPKEPPSLVLTATKLECADLKATGEDIYVRFIVSEPEMDKPEKEKKCNTSPAENTPDNLKQGLEWGDKMSLKLLAVEPPAAPEEEDGSEPPPPAPYPVTLQVALFDQGEEEPPLTSGEIKLELVEGAEGLPFELTLMQGEAELKLSFTAMMEPPPEPEAEEEAPPPEPEAPPAEAPKAEEEAKPEGEAEGEEGGAAAEAEEEEPKAPDMVYTLDIATGMWTAALLQQEPGAEPLVEVPDFVAKPDD
jgi:hypothetical protein